MKIGEYIRKIREEKELSINQLALYSNVSAAHISRIERGLRDPSPEILEKIAAALKVPYEELMRVAGYLKDDVPNPADKIADAIADDPELAEFWDDLRQRDDLKLLFKQIRELSPSDVKRIIRIIKAIEDEEAAETDI